MVKGALTGAAINGLMKKMTLGVNHLEEPIAVLTSDDRNAETLHINSRELKRQIFIEGQKSDHIFNSREVDEIKQSLCDAAEASGNVFKTYLRVAPFDNGVEIDMGDANHTRCRLIAGKVEIVTAGSGVLFTRPSALHPFVSPAESGDINELLTFLNLELDQAWLLIIWICYTLSTPKSEHAAYPILVLIAEQGASKSTTCKLIIRSLLDPSALGIQGFTGSRQDIVLASKHAHLLVYDNMRYLSRKLSDTLCIASTGGNDPTRRLYTDSELVNHPFQTPLVLNGISDFIEEPDLAQRCIRLELKAIPEKKRRDAKEFADEFNTALPSIFRGLLDLTAKILEKLPSVKVMHPQRMLSYVRYLAAAEAILDMENGRLQKVYRDILNDCQRDSVLSDPLAAAVYDLVNLEKKSTWKGTPAELLARLMDINYPNTRHLPNNPIALSKRLKAMAAPLRSQHIEVEFQRSKHRQIIITNTEAY